MTNPDEGAPAPLDGADEPIDAEIVEAGARPAPTVADVTGYTDSGVPTFDHVRDAINRRSAIAQGFEELGSDAADDTERRFAEREKAAKDRLDEIRRSMRTPPEQ